MKVQGTKCKVQSTKFVIEENKIFFILIFNKYNFMEGRMSFSKFEDIKAWQKARELNKSIYLHSSDGNFKKDYSLKDQLQRASVSVMLNIAEGFDSGINQSFLNFLRYSFRSTSEVKSIIYIALDLNYISEEQFNFLLKELESVRNLIYGLIRYFKDKSTK